MTGTSAISSQQGNRIIIIDILRGWALLGVVLMNFSNFASLEEPSTDMDRILYPVMEFLFSVKSWSLLSVLFGFGFGALYDKIRSHHTRPSMYFLRRMMFLLLVSVINICFYSGDILHDYALLGCILLLFVSLNARTLFITGVVLLVINMFTMPLVSEYLNPPLSGETRIALRLQYLQGDIFTIIRRNFISCYLGEIRNMNYFITVHVQMFGLMLAGLAAYKYRFFENLAAKRKLIFTIFITSLVSSAVLTGFRYLFTANEWQLNKYFRLSMLQHISVMVMLSSAITLLFARSRQRENSFPVFYYSGKMTLTNYMVQSILMILLFSGAGLALGFKLTVTECYIIAAVIYHLQYLLSRWWLSRYYYGPVEWVWRSLSYGRKFANRKNAADHTG